jgi:L-asparaginase II
MYQLTDFVPLAALHRGTLLESLHIGATATVDSTGEIVESHGLETMQIFPRSAVKPLIALVMRRLGVELEGAELAVTASSHYATPAHLQLVANVLARYGFDFDALRCPAEWPKNGEAARAASQARPEFMNCSGKHAGFLAAAKINGWSTDDYLNPEHPVQRAVFEGMREFSGEEPINQTVDGCGAPAYSISLSGLARSVSRLMLSQDPVLAAMIANPWAVSDKPNSDARIASHGYLTKIGAEGVFVIGAHDGTGIAVKVADGSPRASGSIALKLLRNRGLIDEASYSTLRHDIDPKVLGGGLPVGSLEVLI